jgi:hypothetical protein
MSSLAIWSLISVNANGLPDQVCRESPDEAHQHGGCGYRGDQVNGPRAVAFTHKVDVSRAAFVSIYVKVHRSGLRLRNEAQIGNGKAPLAAKYITFGPLINIASRRRSRRDRRARPRRAAEARSEAAPAALRPGVG